MTDVPTIKPGDIVRVQYYRPAAMTIVTAIHSVSPGGEWALCTGSNDSHSPGRPSNFIVRTQDMEFIAHSPEALDWTLDQIQLVYSTTPTKG